MSLNLVVQDGIVQSPALRYGPDGKPELRFTLDQRDGEFHLWLPCCAVGSAAERLASELEDGQHVVITSGKLYYRKRTTKAGEHSRLEILVWTVDQLSSSLQDETSGRAEGDASPAGEIVPPEPTGAVRRPRRRPYPKAALQGGFAET
jgi:single-stranded DNA-binding protein